MTDETQTQLDIGWAHGFLVDAKRKRVQCNYCAKQMNGGVFRLKHHLAGTSGNVSKCDKCPKEVAIEIRDYLAGRRAQKGIHIQQQQELHEELSGRQSMEQSKGKGKGKGVMRQNESEEEDSDDDMTDGEREAIKMRMRSQCTREGGTGSQQRQPGPGFRRADSLKATDSDAFLLRRPSVKQPKIKQAMKGVKASASAAKHAVKNIVKWFLHLGVPAHTASSPYFQTMIDSIGEAGPGLKGPTQRDIYGKHLEEEMAETKEWVSSFKAVWMDRGCTLMCDGWTGTTRRSMINFLVYCSEDTVFMKSVDASGKIKNADYLFKLMDDMVEEIGESNIVQVVTDNEASYKAAGRKLMDKRKHLYWVPCAAHSLDLMMEDIGKDKHVADLVSKAQKITSFIYGHNRILHMMRECTDGHDIIRPGPTRFASNFIALESLYKFRHELATLMHSSDYLAHVCTLRGEDVAHEVSFIIGDNRFWDKVSYYLKLIEPLVQVLRMVDGEDKNDMGYLYEAMDKAKERLKKKHPTAFKKWWTIIDRRWERTLHHDLHATGYFLNPRHQYSDSVHNDGEVLEGTINVIGRLTNNIDEKIDAMLEIDRFKLKLDIYRDYELVEAVNRVHPAEWWIMLNYKTGQTNPLARVAIRVLSQTTTSSQCERNWSTFSLIHTKVRNRLSAPRLEKLVYCHYNMRLKVKCIKQRQKKTEQRLMTFAGGNWEKRLAEREAAAASPLIDVDELLDEEHPLRAWVETREERDVPEFDPQDVSWAEGELEGVVARDPELRVSDPSHPPPVTTLPDEPRVSTQSDEVRRVAKEKEKLTYMRQRKRRVLQRSHSHSSSSSDDNDDDDGAATGATGGGAAQGDVGGSGSAHIPTLQPAVLPYSDISRGEGQGEYEGQQRQATYGWPSWDQGQDYTSGSSYVGVETSEATNTDSYKPLAIWCPTSSSQSGPESSTQQYTPRGIQRGMHDLADSIFSYGYGTYETNPLPHDEASSSAWQDY